MPRFIIEREVPGAGSFSADDLRDLSQKSCAVLAALGPSIQWIESFVTQDKLYCVYQAADESLIRRHAEQGGFPANSIASVKATIAPVTAEQ